MKNKLESHTDEGETADLLSKDTRVFNEKNRVRVRTPHYASLMGAHYSPVFFFIFRSSLIAPLSLQALFFFVLEKNINFCLIYCLDTFQLAAGLPGYSHNFNLGKFHIVCLYVNAWRSKWISITFYIHNAFEPYLMNNKCSAELLWELISESRIYMRTYIRTAKVTCISVRDQ